MMDYKTEHYIFHCVNNEIAENDIEIIAKTQEEAYEAITKTLNVKYETIINYYLVNTPEEVTKLTQYPYPVNGLACFSNKSIYAVYNDEIKCIGPHEDAHLISETFGMSDLDFLCEGLAMYFDKCWWGIDNCLWCKYFIDEGIFPNIIKLLNNQGFNKIDCSLSYPVAGAFTSYLIEKFGIEKYRCFYINNFNSTIISNQELEIIVNGFIDKIKHIDMNAIEKARIKVIYESNII